jgi:hypothetical protein
MLSKGDRPTSSKTASVSRVTAAFVALFLSSEISGTAYLVLLLLECTGVVFRG